LLGQGNIGAQLIFPKYLFWAYLGGLKVKNFLFSFKNTIKNTIDTFIWKKVRSSSNQVLFGKIILIHFFVLHNQNFFLILTTKKAMAKIIGHMWQTIRVKL
jgi:hypothetical protein